MKKVGDILRKKRLETNLSIDDISKFTKIHSRYLKALEAGNYNEFADPVHIKGFLRNYSNFLKIDSKEVLALFRREYQSENLSVPTNSKYKKNGVFANLKITPKVAIAVVVIFVFLGFGSYLFVQYQSYAGLPPLVIESPEDNTVTTVSEIWIRGKSNKNALVSINNKEVKLTETGSFRYPVTLSNGQNIFIVTATNKVNKSVEREIKIYLETEGE